MNPFGRPTQNELARASASGTAAIFNGLHRNLQVQQWLQATNAYRSNCLHQIAADLDATTGTGINGPDLAEYIAASVPLHCSDGWTFLARSLSAYINGNPHQAAHFAYYAELRAAMSILGSQGVGVFNRKHFFIDHAGQCQAISAQRSTHEFVWLALDDWSNRPSSGVALLNLFVVSGISVKDWFSALPGSSVASSFASYWLRNWGIDLSAIDTDHDVRNLASYRPNEFSTWNTDARACSEFLRSMWALFEPATTRFETLDRHLLRMLVRKTILSVGDPADPNREDKARQQLTTMLNNLAVGDPERNRSKEFLLSTDPEPSLLTMAEAVGGPNDPHVHERVIARAALLLRVASGFTAQLIEGATFKIDDLNFWTWPLGNRRAFWKPGAALDDFSDLWLDVSAAMDDEAAWITAQDPGDPLSMQQWRLQREETIRPLAECDRVALWALQR